MKQWMVALAAMLAAGSAQAGESGDQLAQSLYDGTLRTLAEGAIAPCQAGEGDACFVLGLDGIVTAYETLAQGFYRHGAVTPDTPAAAMLLGMGSDTPSAPANPVPEPLSYEQFVELLDGFVATLDVAAGHMRQAGEGSAFVIPIDPLRVRIDLNGDGERDEGETLAILLVGLGEFSEIPTPDAVPQSSKSKSKGVEPIPPDATVGFDNADAIWFAGYANVTAAPVDLTLAHDFSDFFAAYMHRIFPEAGLPMQDYARGGTVMMDPDSDAFVADLIAAIHTAEFPVTDQARLAGVLERLRSITTLSRQHWEMILAETDDDRELVPSPSQTSLVPGREITQEVVGAWLATLDQVDLILDGELLLPHWRFDQGFNLKTYFETATETDLVMLFTGHDALPYLDDGPVADAADFAELNRVMGDDWPFFAIWFN
ncbi:hypothetical protein [Devosia sediminis]|uniref:Uncharacterized protein n=1 Tax=Devosia sediminis TaxID=2798801 RepID=A0A934MPW8_9HYPH|nr:hypothetical protein [Devosia sediminis]MBJ3783769.1 hypothetical protein [Devosia sediminis]